MTPKKPDNAPEPRSIVYSKNAAKSLKIIKVSQRKSYEKILGVAESLQEYDFPPNIEITKMSWKIHGNDVYTARIHGKPEYRIIFQLYEDHVAVDDIVTREQFHKRISGYGR